MVDSERLLKLKKAEHARKMREWDEICPNGFVDVNIKENLTSKHRPTDKEPVPGGGSSLEDIV